MEIAGLPLHPLVVHATVVFVPLSALSTIVFAVVPRWRWLTRWPTAVLAVVALVVSWLARLSGAALLEARPELAPLVATHQGRGNLLSWVVIGYAAVVLVAAWSLAGQSALASGRGARTSQVAQLDKVLPVLAVLASVVALVIVVLAGDSGSRAVWG